MQMQREKIAAAHRPAALKSELGHVRVAHVTRQAVDVPQALGIGDGLDVESQNGRHAGIRARGRRKGPGILAVLGSGLERQEAC